MNFFQDTRHLKATEAGIRHPCYYAVRGIDNGPAADYWELSDWGWILVDANGRTTWENDPDGLHRYKIRNLDPEIIAEEIEKLMMHIPVP